MTSKAGVATAKGTVGQYRTLLAERRALVSSYLSDYDRYLNALPRGDFKAGAMLSMEANKAATVKLYADLDTAQTAWTDSISNVLDWADKQAGRLTARGEQLMFTTTAQQAELSALVGKVQTSETSMNKVLTATAAAQAAAQAKTKANMAEADKLLAK